MTVQQQVVCGVPYMCLLECYVWPAPQQQQFVPCHVCGSAGKQKAFRASSPMLWSFVAVWSQPVSGWRATWCVLLGQLMLASVVLH